MIDKPTFSYTRGTNKTVEKTEVMLYTKRKYAGVMEW